MYIIHVKHNLPNKEQNANSSIVMCIITMSEGENVFIIILEEQIGYTNGIGVFNRHYGCRIFDFMHFLFVITTNITNFTQ